MDEVEGRNGKARSEEKRGKKKEDIKDVDRVEPAGSACGLPI
jgi:hypothetical protein